MLFKDLIKDYNLDPNIIKIWNEYEGESLLPLQNIAILDYGLLEGKSLIVSAPTSSGKTLLGELALIKQVYQRKKGFFLVPMKALAEEKYNDFREKYNNFGIKVVLSSRDHREYDKDIGKGNFNIAIIVYEKLEQLLIRYPDLLNYCGIVIIDEIQMLMEENRGEALEFLLTHILNHKEKRKRLNEDLQIIGLSAVLGDVDILCKWLGAGKLLIRERPIELQEGIYTPDGTFHYKEYNSAKENKMQFPPFTMPEIPIENEFEAENLLLDVLTPLSQFLLDKNEQILIFRKFKGLSRKTALHLANKLKLESIKDAQQELESEENTISKRQLLETLEQGIAFHNADLTLRERLIVEKYFRIGKIKLLVATSTLAQGINLPADNVIIPDLEVIDSKALSFHLIPISIAMYKNISGRAGRYKYRRVGRSILLAKDDFTKYYLWENYIKGKLESFHPRLEMLKLEKLLLSLIASKKEMSLEDIKDFISHTLSGWYTQVENQAKSQKEIANRINRALENIKKQKMIRYISETSSEVYQTTEIGTICASSGLNPLTISRLKPWLDEITEGNFDELEILFLLCHSRELEKIHFRLSKLAYQDERYIQPFQLGLTSYKKLLYNSQQLLGNRYESVKRAKMTLLLRDWINQEKLEILEENYNLHYDDKAYAGVIRELVNQTAWVCNTLSQLIGLKSLSNFDKMILDYLSILAKRLTYGLKEINLEFISLIPLGLHRDFIILLEKRDINTIIDLRNSLNELKGILPEILLSRLRNELTK